MRRATVALCLVVLVGCGSAGTNSSSSSTDRPSSDDSLVPVTVHAEGRTLLCVKYTAANRGGLWCEDITPKATS